MFRARLFRSVPCALAVLGISAAQSAAAQPASVAGTWQAGATSMDVAVQSWGKDCGPRPQSTRSSGGGSVRLEQQGKVVIIRGADRDLRSDRCWSPNPAMRKVSSSASDGLWLTRCQTAADDPRKESGTYTLRALGPDTLQYQDVSHFDWRLNDSTCVATITTTQTLTRTRPANSAGTAKPAAAEAPCTPGAPARIVMRPRRADLELGERVCFQTRVLDAAGCALAGVEPSLSLRHGKAIKGTLERNCFRAGQRSAEAEGTFTVVATHAGLRAGATVQVSAMTLQALLAKRLETGAVQGEADGAADPDPAAAEAPRTDTSTHVAAKALAAPEPPHRRMLIGLAALLAATAAGLLLLRARPRARARALRAHRSSQASELTATSASASRTSQPATRERIRRCPTCGASYPEGSAFCGADGTALAPPE